MASIYDKASLVLIPSGSKTSKVYSQKPVSGDGDLTFSRSTAATRVNASGNIEKETQNLLLQSNSFDTTWVAANGATISSGEVGYDGTNDAWLLTKSTNNYSNINQSVSASGVNTYSVYAKGTSTNFCLRDNVSGTRLEVNLNDGSITLQQSGIIVANVQDVGGGWYRVSATFNETLSVVQIYPKFNSADVVSVTIQDAQLEQGLVARDYIETTTTAIYGGITDNVPRLDYTDSSCPALLLEPQRSNLVPHSEYFETYTYYGSPTITHNNITSPEGLLNGTKVVKGTNAVPIRVQSITSLGTEYTMSIWAKAGTASQISIDIGNESAPTYDLTSEWQRFEVTSTPSSSTHIDITMPTASVGEYIYIYGLQLEEGSYATSYIPTYGSAVTRNQDTLQLTGMSSDVASGATSGTLMIEFDYTQQSFGDVVQWYSSSTATGRGYLYNRSLGFADTWGSAGLGTTDGVNTKVIWRLDSLSSGTFFKDGVKGNDVDTTTQAWNNIDNLFIRGHYGTINVRQIIFVPYALSNQEAIDLTTI